MNFKSYLLFAVGAALFVTGCKKGDTGATGATGATGSTGTTGPTGPAGTPANVIYSDWVNFHQVPLVHRTGLESNDSANSNFNQVIAAPKLTSDVLDKATLLLYIKASDGVVYNSTSLYGIYDHDAAGFVNYGVYNSFSVGKVNVFAPYDQVHIDRFNALGEKVRYVIIPGVTTSGRIATGAAAGRTIEELKKLSYAEVAKLFNIQ